MVEKNKRSLHTVSYLFTFPIINHFIERVVNERNVEWYENHFPLCILWTVAKQQLKWRQRTNLFILPQNPVNVSLFAPWEFIHLNIDNAKGNTSPSVMHLRHYLLLLAVRSSSPGAGAVNSIFHPNSQATPKAHVIINKIAIAINLSAAKRWRTTPSQ